ncbi:synaptotagmin-like protein 1 isoform X2 [Narcine bancroftii]|uniref:synaptotagmin-like protein 1 isoform X2 n=1 Tax=Narcine bancroftii TaxID=1343680 RepID=UPI003831679B
MALDFNVEELIDLSFLTDEEQDVIVQVLCRDTKLRLLDEQRIKQLQQSVLDPEQLRIATGDWFKEARARRHTDKRFGSDFIRASIHKKKRTKDKREKEVTINDEKIMTNKLNDQEQEECGNENFVVTNEDPINSEPVNTADDETDCKHSETHSRSFDDKHNVTSTVGTFTLDTNDQTQHCNDENSATKDNDWLRTQEDNQSPAIITVKNDSSMEYDDGVRSQNEIEANSPNEGVDTNSSVSSFPSPDVHLSGSMSSFQSSTLGESMMSLYNTDLGCADVRGSITFSLYYNEYSNEFQIHVVQCNDLAGAKKNHSNPYVKSYLLPDKSSQSKRKTSVKKKTLNPTFNEQLTYKREKADLQSRTLNLSVWHRDHFGHNLFLGEVEISLELWDWRNTEPTTYALQPRIAAPPSTNQGKGQLLLSLKYIPAGSPDQGLPSTAEVHIWLKEAQNLISDRSKSINSFVKCSILPDANKSSQQKTRVIKRDLNPVYNHTMVYDGFQIEDVRETCAEFTIWDHEIFSNHLLGGLRLSLGTGLSYGQPVNWMDSNEEEISAWKRMLAAPGHWVDTVLPIRPNVLPSE